MDSINAPRTKKCPQCGKRTFERLISAAAFHLKGGGWYETDFKNKDKPAADKKEPAKESESSKASDDKKESKSDDKKQDKPAKSEAKTSSAGGKKGSAKTAAKK